MFKQTTLFLLLVIVFSINSSAGVILGQNYCTIIWAADPFQNGYNNVTGDNPWKTGFVEECEPYNIIRMMNWNNTNWHYGHRRDDFKVSSPSWADRKQKGDKNQAFVAYEWQIDICNRTNSSIWLCIPNKATDDYCYKLAQLVKNTLKPGLRVIVEWSNEVWNPGFAVNAYCDAMAKSQIDPRAPWFFYYLRAATNAFHQFERVFGADSERLITVISGRSNEYMLGNQLFSALNQRPDWTNPKGAKIDAFAIASYFGEGADASTVDKWEEAKKTADANGVALAFYEGGAGEHTNSFSNEMNAIYDNYLKILEDVGFAFGCHFYHTGGKGWATIPNDISGYAKAMTYPKYKKIANYCKANPMPPVDQPMFAATPVSNPPRTKKVTTTIKQKATTQPIYNLQGKILGNAKISERTALLPKGVYITGGSIFLAR